MLRFSAHGKHGLTDPMKMKDDRQVGETSERGPFVRLDQIRPGDVLLTRGTASRSRMVSWKTGGQYSHAAIWLPVEEGSSPELAESEELGVGFTPLRVGVLKVRANRFLAAALPTNAEAYCVLRHPALESLNPASLLEASTVLQDRYFNRPFSSLRNLLGAAELLPIVEKAAEKALRLIDVWRNKTVRPGPFCSELVSAYFQALGLEVVVGKDPDRISPNALHGESSVLVEVPGVLVEFDVVEEMDGFEPPPFTREHFLPYRVRQAENAAATLDLVHEIHKTTDQLTRESREESRARQRSLDQLLNEQLNRALESGQRDDALRLSKLIGRSNGLWRLGTRIEMLEQEAIHVAGKDAADLRPFTEMWGKYGIEQTRLAYDHLRFTALQRLRRVRGIQRTKRMRPFRRAQLVRIRRQMVSIWQAQKADQVRTVDFISSLMLPSDKD